MKAQQKWGHMPQSTWPFINSIHLLSPFRTGKFMNCGYYASSFLAKRDFILISNLVNTEFLQLYDTNHVQMQPKVFFHAWTIIKKAIFLNFRMALQPLVFVKLFFYKTFSCDIAFAISVVCCNSIYGGESEIYIFVKIYQHFSSKKCY